MFLGYGTTHKVNNLIIQGKFGDTSNRLTCSPKRKRCRRSFQAANNEEKNNYRYKKRVGPVNTKLDWISDNY